jgi:hypothetical protein
VSNTSGAAAPLFAALDAQGSDAFAYPPGTPITNYIAAFMIFEPRLNRAG